MRTFAIRARLQQARGEIRVVQIRGPQQRRRAVGFGRIHVGRFLRDHLDRSGALTRLNRYGELSAAAPGSRPRNTGTGEQAQQQAEIFMAALDLRDFSGAVAHFVLRDAGAVQHGQQHVGERRVLRQAPDADRPSPSSSRPPSTSAGGSGCARCCCSCCCRRGTANGPAWCRRHPAFWRACPGTWRTPACDSVCTFTRRSILACSLL